MDEDTPPRWINHFYDPINNEGWEGENTGVWPKFLVQYFSSVILSSKKPASSLDWLHNQKLQEEYAKYKGNHTWERAIYEYLNGNKKEAYYTLGFILHLIEDATVPAHTRNDTHAHELRALTGDYGSPYEEYNKRHTRDNFHIAQELKQAGQIPNTEINSIDEFLISLAEYSNKYFFSKDTIYGSKYAYPKVVSERNGFGYGRDENGENFELVRVRISFDDVGNIKKDYLLKTKKETEILSQYSTRLFRKAITNGAGVIDLFFREIDAIKKGEKETPRIYEKSTVGYLKDIGKFLVKSAYGPIAAALEFGNVSIVGEISKIIKLSATENKQEAAVVAGVPQAAIPPTTTYDPPAGEAGVAASIAKPNEPNQISEPKEPAYEVGYDELARRLDSARDSLERMQEDVQGLAVHTVHTADYVESSVSNNSVSNNSNNTDTSSDSETSGIIEPKFSLASLPYVGFGGGGGGTQPQVPDEQGEQQEELEIQSEPEPIPQDITPPDVSLTISECSTSLSSDGCLVATTTLNIFWSSTADDLNYFTIDSNGAISTTTATSTKIITDDNSTFVFSVSAVDTTGNHSSTTTKTAEISLTPIVINEVAWAGTEASAHDEWIELYNRTDHDINLDGWTLYSETDLKPYINLSGTVQASDFYLIERSDDDGTVSDIAADWKGSFGGGKGKGLSGNSSSAKGEVLVLSRSSTTIDKILTKENGDWSAGNNNASMERYSPDLPGTDISNWGANIGTIKNGVDANGQSIKGTPKARNSVNYLIEKNRTQIDYDVTLFKERSPYLVNEHVQFFMDGATLTVEPGTVIKFYGRSGLKFKDGGMIKAIGTADEPIVFTSFYDDKYDEDLNADATTISPSVGDWYGIEVMSEGSVFDNAVISYGGAQQLKHFIQNGALRSHTANLSVKNASVSVSNSMFEYSDVYGIKLVNSSSIITNNTFRFNNNETESRSSGIYLGEQSAGTIESNLFQENRSGIYSEYSSPTIKSNTFIKNIEYPIISAGLLGSFSNNIVSENGTNGILLAGYLAEANATSTMKADNMPYVLSSNCTIASNSTLVVEKGAVLKAVGAEGSSKAGALYVRGTLIIDGENPGDIIFTSLSDDSVGEDTKRDGETFGSPGSWQGIIIKEGGYSRIKGATFKYADIALTYEGSPINFSIDPDTVEFIDNTATTSPEGLW